MARRSRSAPPPWPAPPRYSGVPARPVFTLLVEGWRRHLQSYAIVNCHQLAELAQRPNLRLFHRDYPVPARNWPQGRPVLGDWRDLAVARLPAPPANLAPDALLRMRFPYDIGPGDAGRVFTFLTCEFGFIPPDWLKGATPANAAARILTPSRWSRDGLVHAGFSAGGISIVPHGVDPALCRPADEADRAAMRRALGFADRFVFLHVSALTWQKNIGALLWAFARVAEHHPDALLCLKGLDSYFQSRQRLREVLNELDAAARDRILPRLTYFGGEMPPATLANLHQAADAYLTPYLAEAFNMPALEAAACGLPVIATAGGPTDEFLDDRWALRIASKRVPAREGGGYMLRPDRDDLVAQMRRAIDDAAMRQRARRDAPPAIVGTYAWSRVADRLLEALAAGA